MVVVARFFSFCFFLVARSDILPRPPAPPDALVGLWEEDATNRFMTCSCKKIEDFCLGKNVHEMYTRERERAGALLLDAFNSARPSHFCRRGDSDRSMLPGLEGEEGSSFLAEA